MTYDSGIQKIYQDMKFKPIFIAVLLLSIGQQAFCQSRDSTKEIVYDFSLPVYDISDTVPPAIFSNQTTFNYIRVKSSNWGIIDSTGRPELPFISYNFEIPYSAHNIEITITEAIYENVSLDYHIIPFQGDLPKDSVYENRSFHFDERFYNSREVFMTEEYKLMDTFVVRGTKGVRVSVMPFKYSPYRKQLTILKNARLHIKYHTTPRQESTYNYSIAWENILNRTFVNHISTTRAPSTENYLIITLPQYADALQYFADYKQSLGYNVIIHSLNESQRTPIAIKQLILNYYNSNDTRPDFILLVGDHPQLPACEGDSTSEDIDNPITDVSYTFLEGDDYYRDVLIGRWPVHNTADVQTIANKTIYMEMNMHLHDKKAVFIAGTDDNSINQYYFEQGHADVIDDTFEPNGYDCTQLDQPNRATALSYLNDDPLFYVYSGHGWFYYWAVRTQDFSNSWSLYQNFIDESSHKTFPSVFAFACKTGNFADSICIAESWILNKNGSTLYLGSSVNTLVLSDYRIEKKLFGDALYDEPTIGGIVAIGMKRYYDAFFTTSSHAKRYIKSYNLMGDPSFLVRGLGCNEDYYVERMRLGQGDKMYYRAARNVVLDGDISAGYGSELIVRAGQEIILQDGFMASAGSEVTMQIEECVSDRLISHNAKGQQEHAEKKLLIIPKNQEIPYKVTAYPNPTSNKITVEVEGVYDNNLLFQVVDIFGRITLEKKNSTSKTNILDLSHLPSGCYYIVTIIGENKDYKCIIKQ